MNKINKLWILALACTLTVTMPSCGDDDEFDTQQYTGGISLNVFGPSPVVRGGTLRFLGSNLDKITQVIIPGVDPITDITIVESGVPSEIRVTVPKEGPTEGYVQLVASDGTTLTTASILTYEETIEFTSFSPSTVMAGDVLTITGDYLNLIEEVIFTDNIIVKADEFLSQDRYTITVTVPDEAQTGEVTLSDGDSTDEELTANLIVSEEELIVGTPSISSFTTDSRFKAGAALTITGTYLQLASQINFEGAEVGSDEFSLNAAGTAITLAQPEKAASGEVTLTLVSGVEITAATEDKFQVVTPSNLAITSSRVKAGLALTITGNDLDLVTSVTFADNVDGVSFSVGGSSSIEIDEVPESAVDGNVTLGMANGMSASVAYNLVKPEVTGYSEAAAGSEVIIYGSDLDLVTSVSFGGGSYATPDESSSDSQLIVTVPMDSNSGTVTLALKNGTSVEAEELEIEEAKFCYITELPEEEPNAGDMLTVTVANADKLTSVEVNGTPVQYVLLGETLYIAVPETAGSGSTFTLISSNGEVSYTIDVYSENEIGTVVWTGSYAISGWNGFSDLSWGGYDWSQLSVGMTLTIWYDLDMTQTYWQMRVAKGSGWSALSGTTDPYDLADTSSLSLVLTDAMLSELVDEGGLILTGHGYTITQISYK